MGRKLTYEFVKEQFEKEGYKLLSEGYKGVYQKLAYECPKGHKHSISWNNWSQGKRCFYCAIYKKANKKRLDINFIRSEFEKESYRLLTIRYTGSTQKLKYICSKGHEHSIIWSSWQQGHRCPYCKNVMKIDINFIKSEFKKEEYKLLSKAYINSKQKLWYKCSKGHEHSIKWNDFQQGCRCPTCKNIVCSIRIYGENNPNWKGGISCEPYCDVWLDKDFKQSIKDRDGNRCLNPDCWRNCNHLPMHIHHIDHNKKNCNPNNLITVCNSCNGRAKKQRKWHESWYKAILNKRYEI